MLFSTLVFLEILTFVFDNGSPWSLSSLSRVSKNRNNQIPQIEEQESRPNLNPASKEMISDSVELCETEVCFLHIQLIGTNV